MEEEESTKVILEEKVVETVNKYRKGLIDEQDQWHKIVYFTGGYSGYEKTG